MLTRHAALQLGLICRGQAADLGILPCAEKANLGWIPLQLAVDVLGKESGWSELSRRRATSTAIHLLLIGDQEYDEVKRSTTAGRRN